MPRFSTNLPAEGPERGWSLKRTPESAPITGIATADKLLVIDTHYWHGRTMPCERVANEDGTLRDDTACPACAAKQSYRTHAYISAWSEKTGQHFLFECTATAAKPFADYIAACGTLRGCGFAASRIKPTKNARVNILTKTANLGKLQLPPPPDVLAALAVIWRLPASAFVADPTAEPLYRDRTGHATAHPHATPREEVLRAMRTPPDNGLSAEQFEQQKADALAALTAPLVASKNGRKP